MRSKSSLDTRTRCATQSCHRTSYVSVYQHDVGSHVSFYSSSFPLVARTQVFGMAWSPDGKLLATVCKDGKVRIYDPRKSTTPVQVPYNTLTDMRERNKMKHRLSLFLSKRTCCVLFLRRAQVLRATEELVWCGCARANTCWCRDLTGNDPANCISVRGLSL